MSVDTVIADGEFAPMLMIRLNGGRVEYIPKVFDIIQIRTMMENYNTRTLVTIPGMAPWLPPRVVTAYFVWFKLEEGNREPYWLGKRLEQVVANTFRLHLKYMLHSPIESALLLKLVNGVVSEFGPGDDCILNRKSTALEDPYRPCVKKAAK